MILEYIVDEENNKKTVKHILKSKLNISNVLLIKLKNNKSIFLNGNLVNVNEIINTDDKITVNIKQNMDAENSFTKKFQPWDIELNILYEDEYLIIVDKSYNTPVHPSANNYTHTLANAVINYLIKKGEESSNIHIVTRLDKDTSGICIFAKNAYVQELFIRKKESINLRKTYLAVVNGIIEKDHDIIYGNITRKSNSIILREVSDDEKIGDFAKTEYTVLKRNYEKNNTILEILLHTGRTHQIRVHMSYIGHTLLGDELYSNEHDIKSIRDLIKRQALHAFSIQFNHPITNKKLYIECHIPSDMQNLNIV